MSLLRWIQGNSQTSSNPSNNTQKQQTSGTSAAGQNVSNSSTADSQITSTTLTDGPDAKRFGFENFGNTCYANSVLQALYFCQPFRDLLLASTDSSAPSPPPSTQPNLAALPVPPLSSTPAKRSPSKSGHKRQVSANDDPALSDDLPPPTPAMPIPVNPSSLFSALRSLYGHISSHPQPKGTISPQAFVNKLKKENVLFRSSMHQDAHEFLNFLLNKIVEDLEEESKTDPLSKSISSLTSSTTASTDPSSTSTSPSSTPPPLPLVQSLFQGTLTNETRCLTCERVTSRSEPFLDLSLDIEQNTSLTACLRGFSKSEMLTNKNKFFCDECCALVEAEKRMKIKTLPPVLLLHLKRFKYQEDVQRYIKLSYRVAFPLELRMFNNIVNQGEKSGVANGSASGVEKGFAGDPEGLYYLFAVVVHIGGGPHHGHYVTLVKSHDTWVLFDDDAVEMIKESDIPKYFGDASFTVEGAINPPAPPQVSSPAAVSILKSAGMTVTGTTATGGLGASAGGAGGMIAPGPQSGVSASANGTTGSMGMKQDGVQGSGYVLFYQAAGMDMKALGLSRAGVPGLKEAKDVKEMVGREMAARNGANGLVEVKVNGPEPVTSTTTTTTTSTVKPIPIASAHVPAPVLFTDEPETSESLGIPGTSPSVNPNMMSQASPSLSSSYSSTSAAIPPPVSPNGGAQRVPRHALSLDTGATWNVADHTHTNGALSPHALTSAATPTAASHNHHHLGAGGFFRSLKHSTSVKVTDKSALSMSSPLLVSVPNEKEKEKEKDREKEKEKGGWFSTARKSVKRKDKGKDKKESIIPPALPTKEKDASNDDVIAIEPEHTITGVNGYGSWEPERGNGLSAGAGDSPLRRPSAPAMLESPFVSVSGTMTPTTMTTNTGVDVVVEEEDEFENGLGIVYGGSVPQTSSASSSSARLSPHPLSNDQSPNSANGSTSRLALPRMPTSSTVLHVPPPSSPISSTTPPMTAPILTGARPRSAGGRHAPRKSITLFDPPPSTWSTSPPVPSLPAFSGPIPRPSKERDRADLGTETQDGLKKRSSRKMSLSGGTLRLSGFGWHSKDKSEKDHRN